MINEKNKESLINYRLQQAEETISEIQILLDNKLYRTAVNRIYYGMFYALLALALKYNFQSSKHLQLIGWFNKNFIKTNITPIEYGKILRNAFENRMDGDYAPYMEFTSKDILDMMDDMIDFINQIKGIIKNQL